MDKIFTLTNALIFGKKKNVIVKDSKISEISDDKIEGKIIDIKGNKLYPGLFDIHTHGLSGMDTMEDDIYKIAEMQLKNGTTSFLPTTMTDSFENIKKVVNINIDNSDNKKANIVGFHLEGPYISEKYAGAQNKEFIRNPSIDELKKLKNVSFVTLAPEKAGSEQFIKYAKKNKIVVSLGHTDADFDISNKAMKCGANCLSHTFNAMPPLLHRAPGPIGSAIENNAYVQIIADGVHVDKSAVIALYRIFGVKRMILISDSMKGTLLPDGEYTFGGQKVIIKDRKAIGENGKLAGSTSTLFDIVKSSISMGIPEKDAFRMASETPAKLLGIKKGQIKVGYDAEFIIVDKNNNLIKSIIL